MHRQGDGALHRGKIHVHAPVVVGHLRGLELLVCLGAAVNGQVVLRRLVRHPDGGPARRLGGHHVDAVAVLDGQARDARAHKLHHLVLDIALGVHRADDRERHVLRTHARLRLARQVDGHNARTRHVIGAAHQLLGQLAAAFAHRQRAQRAIARVAVRAQNHAPAAGHHLAVVAVNDRHVRGHIDAAVLVRRRQRKHVVILIDRAAHRAQAVVAVGEHIRHRERLHARRARRLDDAHVRDVVAGQAVKAHAQVLHIPAFVVRLQNAIGDRALLGLLLAGAQARLRLHLRRVGVDVLAVHQVNAAIVQFDHVLRLLLPKYTDKTECLSASVLCCQRLPG